MTNIAVDDIAAPASGPRWNWLPPVGTWKYHALLLIVGVLVLGPLGGVTAAYMAFSLGFTVGSQVLSGILGSLVTLGYGAEGKHGANLIQTTAASVAGMGAMAALIQAIVWLGLPHPPVLALMLYVLCIGMFGAGVGMLYTPLLVDRLQLTFPSGLAVANILRALADPVLLKRALGRLAGGTLIGFVGAIAGNTVAMLDALDISMSTFGAGMVVGSRIAVPALVASLLFTALVPVFVSAGWLVPGDPYRKIAFLIAVGGMMGASALDVVMLLIEGVRRWRSLRGVRQEAAAAQPHGHAMRPMRLWAWTVAWAAATLVVGIVLLHQPAGYLAFAIAMVFVFALVNGIMNGISDFNPISAAAIVSLLLMVTMGLRDPMVGMLASVVIFVGLGVAGDMQQDRSTGWRLGTSRLLQFRYQTAGLVVGAVAMVGFAQLFLTAYPVLKLDQTVMSAAAQPKQWTSAATYKLVGILRSLSSIGTKQLFAIVIGVAAGLAMQSLRRWLPTRAGYLRLRSGRHGATTGWVLDAVILPSPYAFFFGGFVNITTTAWFAGGGILASFLNWRAERRPRAADAALPSDMGTVALVGGGLIAGESLAALALAIVQIATML